MINIMNTNDDWPSVILCCDDDKFSVPSQVHFL